MDLAALICNEASHRLHAAAGCCGVDKQTCNPWQSHYSVVRVAEGLLQSAKRSATDKVPGTAIVAMDPVRPSFIRPVKRPFEIVAFWSFPPHFSIQTVLYVRLCSLAKARAAIARLGLLCEGSAMCPF